LQAGGLPGHWPHVTLALGQGFNLTAFALSLLLVFRTNSSYDRWWEARKLWGGVVNRTRDVARQVGRPSGWVSEVRRLTWRALGTDGCWLGVGDGWGLWHWWVPAVGRWQ
jgi:hypothetical protein